jgi:hypothetical protein
LAKAGLTINSAHDIWQNLRILVSEHLMEEAEKLRLLVETDSAWQESLF